MPVATHRFGAFELDRNARALRLNGRELALQPRVFDVLLYLVDHGDRVVGKDELLEKLWPGVIVTESSLQRCVSLARAALEQGGLRDAIRNYAKRGYRFQLDADEAAEHAAPVRGRDSPAAAAEAAFAASRWQEAMQHYAAADRAAPLDAEALERWGTAAQCAGDLAAATLPLERAAVAYSSRGAHEAAARVTIALARVQIESLNPAVAQGCLRRAERLLAGVETGVQHGLLAAMTARLHLFTGDLPAATAKAQEARELGSRLASTDIEALGLLYAGIALQASGEAARGLELQNEAGAAVLAGNVSPLLGGIVYCGVVSSCCNCGDWVRAEQWTQSFVRWCERGNVETFTGACLIHQAEVLAVSGKLAEARDAIVRGDELLRSGAPWALGDASRLMGDVLRACGDAAAAERCYREAYSRGWDPYPGYALLLHENGRSDEAIAGLKRSATATSWHMAERKGRYLAYAAQLAAVAGRADEAAALVAELDAAAECWQSAGVAGQVGLARAELLWARGRGDEAVAAFHEAIDTLKSFRAVIDTALARLRLSECLLVRRELGSAEMELATAEAMLTSAGAGGYLERARTLREALARAA